MHPPVNILGLLKNPKVLVFLVVYISFFLDNVLLTVIVPIIPDYLFSNDLNSTEDLEIESLSPLQRKFEHLEKDNGPLGALLASKAFVQLAFTPIIGYVTSIVGYHLPLFLGSINMFFAALLFAYGHNYGVLVLARALHGSSSAAIAVSGMCLLADTLPKEIRSRVMPIAFGGIALGVLIGYPLGGVAYQFIGKSAPFLLIAALIAMNIGLQIYNSQLVKEEVAQERFTHSVEWVNLLKDKNMIIISGAICICTSSMAILEPCVPLWLLATITPPPSKWQLGAVFIPDSIGYFIGSHFAGLFPAKAWRIALSAMIITGLSCCAIPLATSIGGLTLPHFGLGLGVGVVDAALVPLLANLVDTRGNSQYGPIYALQQASVSLAYSFGPLLGGRAVHAIGFPWLMRLVGFINVLFCPLLIELDNDKESECLKTSSLPTYSTLENSPEGGDVDANWGETE
ncbi:PREDICTED: synaptic vesicular amine transporter-like [Nicrophorus vespilloides]|uniref:Synaptic vesicular amine transporter-like n=1 Tax=Nicrophorus vespilloides TaxID=110193 RepID=A0ABM1NI39_NICVS|nr:PREDICTED: synaptic vesicular amine transporter-like [Nicrophorus vespilloides]